MRRPLCLLALSFVLIATLPVQARADQRIGGGIEYLRTLGDIKDSHGFDRNAVGLIASYQFATSLLTIEGDLELIPDYGGLEQSLFEPQAYLLLGDLFYAGVGIGAGYFDGEWLSSPFYALRAGVDLPFQLFDLDGFALYRFQETETLKDLRDSDLDSLTFGAMVRFHIAD